MKADLAALEARCEAGIKHLAELEAQIKKDARERYERDAANKAQVRAAMEKEETRANNGTKRGAGGEGGEGGQGEEDWMDVDEENVGKRGLRSAKKGPLGFGSRRLGA